MQIFKTRRAFVTGLASIGAASLISSNRAFADSDGPPETTTVRLPRWIDGSYCWAAEYVAGELMRLDGITDVRFIQGKSDVDHSVWMARGETDFSINFPPNHISAIEGGCAHPNSWRAPFRLPGADRK
jgi:NitT/TauT family transport system substrate-binding protein